MPDLAQVAPVHIITGQEVPPAPHVLPLWIGLALVGAATLITLVAWLISARNARINANATEHAFRALASKLHIPRPRQTLLRKLGACTHTAPVALLISDSALRAAVLCYERTNPSASEKSALRDLLPA